MLMPDVIFAIVGWLIPFTIDSALPQRVSVLPAVVKSTAQCSDLNCSPVPSLDVFPLFVQNSTLPLRQICSTQKWKSVEKLFHAL